MAETRTDERTTPTHEARGGRLRRVRPTRRWAIAAGAAGTALLFGAGLLMSMQSPLAIGSVEVVGAGPELAPAVASAVGDQEGQAFSSVDASEVQQRVAQIEGIAGADVGWTWWNTLTVSVREQTPVGVTADAQGAFIVIDPSGDRIRTVPARPAGLPLIEAQGGAAAQAAALLVAGQLHPDTLGGVDAVAATGARAVELRLGSGTRVVLGAPEDLERKLLLAQQLSPSGAAVINVAVPDRPALSGLPGAS